MKENKWLLILLLFVLMFLPGTGSVNAETSGQISAEGVISIYTISGEKYVSDTGAVQYDPGRLKNDEYISFSFNLTNSGSTAYELKSLYARINGGEPLAWVGGSINARTSVNCHIFYVHMKKYGPGTYDVGLYVNDELIESQTFTILNGWNDKISIPSANEIKSYNASVPSRYPVDTGWSGRSPYIAVYLDMPSEGYTEYAVDFRADHQPKGTYLSVLSFGLTPGSLSDQCVSFESMTHGYAGVQIDLEGKPCAIMSIWDTFCTDKNGKKIKFRPNIIYPNKCRSGNGTFGDDVDVEGTGTGCSVDFDWKEGRSYRALIQQEKAPNGNTTIVFWIEDLETKQWTRLLEYDVNRTNTHMVDGAAFLENFHSGNAGDIRTMVLSNVRVRKASSRRWVGIKEAYFSQNFELPGSFNYGSEGSSFWAITTGVPNRVKNPAAGSFTVQTASNVNPYTMEPSVSVGESKAITLAEKGEEAYDAGDYKTALSYLKPAAEMGNADAQYRLGWLYDTGKGVPQSYKTAMEYYEKAAAQGHSYAMFSLGWFYCYGQGVKINYEKAAEYFRASAALGNTDSQAFLEMLYQNGSIKP